MVVVGQSARHDEETSEERAYALRVAADGTKRWRASYGTGEATPIARTVTNLEGNGFLLAGSRAGAEGRQTHF